MPRAAPSHFEVASDSSVQIETDDPGSSFYFRNSKDKVLSQEQSSVEEFEDWGVPSGHINNWFV